MKVKHLISIITIVFNLIFHTTLYAQTWQYVGKPEWGEGLLFRGEHNFQILKISPSSIPYVAYVDAGDLNKIAVISFNGTNWGYVGGVGFVGGISEESGSYPSFNFSPSGTPYIAYSDMSVSNKMIVKSFNGANWVVVGSKGFTDGASRYTSLAFSPSGVPYVAFNAYNSFITSVMSFDGSNWGYVGDKDISNGQSMYQSLAFSPQGVAYLAFSDNSGCLWVLKKCSLIPIFIF